MPRTHLSHKSWKKVCRGTKLPAFSLLVFCFYCFRNLSTVSLWAFILLSCIEGAPDWLSEPGLGCFPNPLTKFCFTGLGGGEKGWILSSKPNTSPLIFCRLWMRARERQKELGQSHVGNLWKRMKLNPGFWQTNYQNLWLPYFLGLLQLNESMPDMR